VFHESYNLVYQDCLRVHFRQQKGDQLGMMARYPRHLYASLGNSMVSCPMFALGLYSSSFGVLLESRSKLFPGWNQYKHFGYLLPE
jgi:hypothetical protein